VVPSPVDMMLIVSRVKSCLPPFVVFLQVIFQNQNLHPLELVELQVIGDKCLCSSVEGVLKSFSIVPEQGGSLDPPPGFSVSKLFL